MGSFYCSKIVDPHCDDRIIGRESGIGNATLLDGGKHHGSVGKETLPMALDKGGGRRADADDQVERVL
jgi:hypothetical protein